MPGRVVVQWDKDDCADLGIIKVDLLGLGMMAALEDAITIINEPRPPHRTSPAGPTLEPAHPRTSNRWISRICLPTIPPSIGCCRRPTRSACSRSNRARRWRRCRGSSRSVSTTSSSRSPSSGPGPIVGNMVHPYLARRRGDRAGDVPASAARARAGADAGRAVVPGAVAADGDGRGRDSRAARPRNCAGRWVSSDRSSGCSRSSSGCATAWRSNGIPGTAADQIVQSITSFALVWLSRVTRRQLRAHRLCERVPEGALSGGVLHGAAQQPADGVLSPGHVGEGRAAARRALRAGRRAGVRLELPH